MGSSMSKAHQPNCELPWAELPWAELPLACWHNVLRFSELKTIARVACLNRTFKAVAYDDRLWQPHFKKEWSPESCGSLQTRQDGKDSHALYARWRMGQPKAVGIIPGVHGPEESASDRVIGMSSSMSAIRLSQTGALAAWSVGGGGALVDTDVTTCQVRRRIGPRIFADSPAPLKALTLMDSKGLVCTGGAYVSGWDPRQSGIGPSATPTFDVKYSEATADRVVCSMISSDSDGPPQFLTGGDGSRVYVWDLRLMDRGPVRHYAGEFQGLRALARDPHHGTLLGGGTGGITCWDWQTGARLSTRRIKRHAQSLAVGKDRLVSGWILGGLLEWALPDTLAVYAHPELQLIRIATDVGRDHSRIVPRTLQGVGEGPDKILGGTECGSICLWEGLEEPEPQNLPICWSLLEDTCHRNVPVSALAAIDQVVVNRFDDGALQIMRVDADFGQNGN